MVDKQKSSKYSSDSEEESLFESDSEDVDMDKLSQELKSNKTKQNISDSEDDFIFDDSEDDSISLKKERKTQRKSISKSPKSKKNNKNDDSDSEDSFIVDDKPKRKSTKRRSRNNDDSDDGSDDDFEIEMEDEKPKKTITKTIKKDTPKIKKQIQTIKVKKETPKIKKEISVKKETSVKKEIPVKKEIVDSEDEEICIPVKKTIKEKKTSVKRTSTVKKESSKRIKKEPVQKEKVLKHLTDIQLLDRAMQSYKWWETQSNPDGKEWFSLEHAGVIFPPSYVPHHIPLMYDHQPIKLTTEQEELATFYAAVDPDGLPLRDPKAAPIFNKNFFKCFKQSLPSDTVIKDFSKCDFHLIREHILKDREEKKKLVKNVNEKINIQKTYGYALVDGNIQKVGSYMVEPPGLFRGRGLHPKTGTVKCRLLPEQMILNIGINEGVPSCPIPGHNWGDVTCADESTWLVNWKPSIQSHSKYVFLAASSSFKGKADLHKYEKARNLKKFVNIIRTDTKQGLLSNNRQIQQRSTAVWLIDNLALRVGNEKSEDEADTVGCCSLRVEHFIFADNNIITLDFLGKDSMRYYQTIDLNKYELGPGIYKNLKLFCRGKTKGQEVFDQLTVATLNHYFSSIMPGLSAKVFRTYNASITLQKELPKETESYFKLKKDEKLSKSDVMALPTYVDDMITLYNNANREVALLCNHQRSLPKNYEDSMLKLKTKYEELESQTKDIRQWYLLVKKGKNIPVKPSSEIHKTNDKDNDKTNENKYKHYFSKQPTLAQITLRLNQYETKLKKQESVMQNKEENKLVALNTSKMNYMDPRISVAWCKQNEIPIERVFARTLRDKFNWAMSVISEWTF